MLVYCANWILKRFITRFTVSYLPYKENGGERRVMDGIISKVSFSIIFNGSSSGFFQSSKGFSWGTAVLTL